MSAKAAPSGPIATEFGRCYEEQNLGIPMEDALEEMTERVPNLDLRFFATAVILLLAIVAAITLTMRKRPETKAQNPVDQEGTYRLPESQLDRFLLRISIGYPGRSAEIQMLDDLGSAEALRVLAPVVSEAEILGMIEAVRSVYVATALKSYLVDLAEASRRHPGIELGLSPRATLQLAASSRGHAAARGRNYATPDDVKAVALPTLSHRVLVRAERGAHLSNEDAIREVFEAVPVPVAR